MASQTDSSGHNDMTNDTSNFDGTTAWFLLYNEALASRLGAMIDQHEDETDLFWALFDFYNHLMTKGHDDGALLSQAYTSVEVFRERGEAYFEAMFLEAVARLSVQTDDLPAGLHAMEQMAACATPDQSSDVAELAKDIWDSFRGNLRVEQSGLTLASVSRVYASLNDPENQVKAMLEAASLYTSNGARWPANALLNDAMEVAQFTGSNKLVAHVLSEASVAAYDRRDAKAALSAADEALVIWTQLETEAPFRLRANRAMLLMQAERTEEAAEIMEGLLKEADCDSHLSLLSNLASAYRRQGQTTKAKEYITRARILQKEDAVGEKDLELELVAANLAANCEDNADLLQALSAACGILDVGLSCIFRLHHRRGFRERYLNRIENLLSELPAEGAAADIVPLLATVHSGIIADWMAVLSWATKLDSSSTTTHDVHEAMNSVRLYGAPFLHRRVEDHDDAWQPNLEGKAWDALGFAVDAAVASGVATPHILIDLNSLTNAINERREDGWALLVPTFHDKELILWFTLGDAYTRVNLDFEHVLAFCNARDQFARKAITRKVFSAALTKYVNQLSTLLAPEFAKLPQDCPGVCVLQDALDSLPIMAVALNLDELRSRMVVGKFEVRTIPVLFKGKEEDAYTNPYIITAIDSSDDLKLSMLDGTALAQAFEQSTPDTYEAANKSGILAAMENADILIVSTHGWSITNYTDPAFASLASDGMAHAINVGTIQQSFPDFSFRLVLLNACHAGAASRPRVEMGLRTHDSASYPALLLMNQRCTVSAPGWPVFDNVSLLHAGLVGEGLADGLSASRALCRAAARLQEMTCGEAIKRLETLPPSKETALAVRNFRKSGSTELLFLHPYVCGGFGVYSLI